MPNHPDQNGAGARDESGTEKWLSGKRLWIDCTDILRYANAGNRTVSGIQRVIANIFSALDQLGIACGAVTSDYAGLKFVAIDTGHSLSLFADLQSGGCAATDIKAKCAQVQASARQWEPEADDILLIAGAFWLHDPSLLLEMRQIPQLRIATFVHDVLIWRYPAYFLPTDRTIWLSAFSQMLGISDVLMTSSRYVEDEIRACAMALRLPCPDVLRTGMASAFPSNMPEKPSEIVRQLIGKRFVLCVGTLEARKNHAFLLDIWDQLHAEHGDAAPRLVFAGKIGWKVASLLRRMRGLNWRSTHFLHIDSPADSDLAWLYNHCLFSIYPSLAEGWGLPISESLAWGTPCLAANTTSLPEAGGTSALYCPPDDVNAALVKIRLLLKDDFRLQLRKHIQRNFRQRSWQEFTAGLLDALSRPFLSRRYPALPIEQPCSVGTPLREADIASRAAALATLASGWEEIRDDAAYGRPVMKMALRLQGRYEEKLILCCLAAAPGGGTIHVEDEESGEMYEWAFPGNDPEIKQIALSFHPERDIRLSLRVEAGSGQVAVYGMGLSRSAVASKLLSQRLLERIVPSKPTAELIADGRRLVGGLAPRFLRAVPHLARLPLKRARRAARRQDWATARLNYCALLRLRPMDSSAWKQLGHACKELKDYAGAYTAYGMALLHSGDADSRFHAKVMREQLHWQDDSWRIAQG
ncbi:glycosyltransferase family 4 protein [Novosphingobium sp. Chol11]|uniref:glycosyltransferase family 4 protein n=1 Tax=Novosphingobium sp. Chol11 TaxID=1385763 RepID=UPI000BE251EC|nr:glycosyltransferase family 1 protein [Novosphingobium sp. Chol11]